MHPHEQTVMKVVEHSTTWISVEILFTLFAMILTIGGLAGGNKIKLVSIEFGPIRSKWRRAVMVVIGLTILTCIGMLNMQ